MAEDTEVLRTIWMGGINIAFQLSADEVFIPSDPPVPVYQIAPRMSYLPLVMTDRLHKYFQRFVDPETNLENLWLEDSNGNPVRWHWPVGVLYDIECLSQAQCPSFKTKTNWFLTVHYKNFPEGEIVKFSCRDAVESFILSGIKEADALKHKVRMISDMPKNDIKKLLQALVPEKFDTFWSVNRKLMETIGNDDCFRHIPFKIHDQNGKIVQKLLVPIDKSGHRKTLLDLFRLAVPSLFSTNSDKSESEEASPSTNSNPDPCDIEPNSCDSEVKLNFRYLVQGISPPLVTPVQWLSEHLSHPDNFLHICIAPLLDPSS